MLPVTLHGLKNALFVNTRRSYSILGGSSNGGKKKNEDERLIPNAPDWDEQNATESEADVKADHDPDDIESIKWKTAEKFKKQPNN
ncbi:hypothetical protein BC941DRAFT_474735 [Chlamydoabsidia padenii]|nr:hypothetical protein BC941DRAFT_474735 [Chlamydoabsidia padenii]